MIRFVPLLVFLASFTAKAQAPPPTPKLVVGKLFQAIDQSVGMKNVIVVLSADHGVASTPEHAQQAKMPGGYLFADVEDAVMNALNRKFGKANWLIPGAGDTALYFDRETVNEKRIREQDLGRVGPRISHPTPMTGTCPFSSWGPESSRAAMTKRSNPTTLRRR